MRVGFTFITSLFILQACAAQGLVENIINSGYEYLNGHNYGKEDIKWAKRNFRLAQMLSFNKNLYNSARHGLAVCNFAEKDTAAGLRKLKRIIGNKNHSKIMNGVYNSIKPSKKEQWEKYNATKALIDIYIAKKNILPLGSFLPILPII